MNNNTQILELFPTPVQVSQLPNSLGSIVDWFYGQKMLTDKDELDSANYGERSENSYILNEPEAKDISSHLIQKVNEFAGVLGYKHNDFKFGQSWISYKHPGQHHSYHSHPNSVISGVLYFGAPAEKTPAITFHKPVANCNVSILRPQRVEDRRDLKYAQEKFHIEFAPGLLVLFPSYLYHSVPLNKSDKVRCSLAFNSVPKKGLGEEQSLTELLF